MTDLRFTLITDGPTDQVLLRHLSWVLKRQLGSQVAFQPNWADLRPLRDKPVNLAARIERAVDLYPCDLLFIHRDAEGADPSPRYREIDDAVAAAGLKIPFVPVVPVRMTEAWLLFDERAVRFASGNPYGHAPLELPVKSPEKVADPKAMLHDALRAASGLKGRRLRSLNVSQTVYRVAEYIDDFSPLQTVPAFAELCRRIADVLQHRARQ